MTKTRQHTKKQKNKKQKTDPGKIIIRYSSIARARGLSWLIVSPLNVEHKNQDEIMTEHKHPQDLTRASAPFLRPTLRTPPRDKF